MKRREREIWWIRREKYGGKDTPDLVQDVVRLKKGEPLDYVIGFRPFLGCHIDLSCHPLIPRAETEYWVEEFLKTAPKKKGSSVRCLDLCAGSGAVGLAVLKHWPKSRVDFVDIDPGALRQIKLNLKINKLSPRARVISSDLFSQIKGRYDFILANPPYISTGRAEKLSRSVRDWEPSLALFAGSDGLSVIRRIVGEAKEYLAEGGLVYCEFDSLHKKELEKLLARSGYPICDFFHDQYGRWRYVRFGPA